MFFTKFRRPISIVAGIVGTGMFLVGMGEFLYHETTDNKMSKSTASFTMAMSISGAVVDLLTATYYCLTGESKPEYDKIPNQSGKV